MDWIHCNNCFQQPGDIKGKAFVLTNCGHVYCISCVRPDDNNAAVCKICKKPCMLRPLNANLSGEVKDYFTSIETLLEKCQKIVAFQNMHRLRMVEYNKAMVKKYNSEKQQLKEQYSYLKNLQKKISQLETENAALKKAGTPVHSAVPKTVPHSASSGYFKSRGPFTPCSIPSEQLQNRSFGSFRTPKSGLGSNFTTPSTGGLQKLSFDGGSSGRRSVQETYNTTPEYVGQFDTLGFRIPTPRRN